MQGEGGRYVQGSGKEAAVGREGGSSFSEPQVKKVTPRRSVRRRERKRRIRRTGARAGRITVIRRVTSSPIHNLLPARSLSGRSNLWHQRAHNSPFLRAFFPRIIFNLVIVGTIFFPLCPFYDYCVLLLYLRDSFVCARYPL